MERNIRRTIMEPVVRALRDQGNPYRGVLYAGLMITDDGPKVLEFNCRLGDPEAQAVLPRLKTDLLNVMIRAAEGDLGAVSLEWDERPCVAVVVASGGYPGKYATGLPIEGLRESAPDLNVFHAGTVVAPADGASRVVTTARRVVTTGGRVLTVTSLGSDLEDARRKAYAGAANVGFEDSFYRKDIALFA
jgi:phosphoribosylamine--glycine ligase